MLALTCTTSFFAQAQEPLTPLWMHVDPYGAGSLLASEDVLSTRIAYDHGTDRIYRSIIASNWDGYEIQVFDPDGNDITPFSPVLLDGIDVGDYQVTHIIQLSATNDTLFAIVRGEVYFNETDDLNWLKVFGNDGSPYYLVGCGSAPLNAFHRDTVGTLVLAGDELRRYGPTGWPDGSITVPPAQGMAVLGNDLVLGPPPTISRIDRSTMTALPSILVPGSVNAASSICIANGSTAFNYVAWNSSGTMKVGLAGLNSGSIWNTTITLPAQAEPTAYYVDEQGDFWIAIAHNATAFATLGLLYRFHFSGGPFGVNSYSRRIDGIASSAGRLFLTGRQTGSATGTYLAAFDIDLITGVSNETASNLSITPNPANDRLFLHGNTTWTDGWITDATGKTVVSITQAELSSGSIAISDLAVGSYRLSVRNAKDVAQLPFVIVR